jgi:transposase-like protein
MSKIQCPNCKSFKVRSSKDSGAGKVVVGVILLLIVVGLPILIAGIIQMIMPTTYSCKNCNFQWKKSENGILSEKVTEVA